MRIEGSDPRVEGGAVRFKVPHRRPGHPFVVRAERYRVVVIGTKFGVAVNGDRRVDVDVDEGVVEVWNNDVRLARLEPGAALEQLARVRRRSRRRRANAGGEARRRGGQADREVRAARDAAGEGTAVAGAGDDAAAAFGDAPSPFVGARRAAGRHARHPVARARRRDAGRGARRAGRRRCAARAGDLQGARAETRPGRRERRLRDRPDPEREGPVGERRSRPGGATGPTTRTASCASKRTCRSSRRWRAPANPTTR